MIILTHNQVLYKCHACLLTHIIKMTRYWQVASSHFLMSICCRPATTWQHPTPASFYQLHPLHLQADTMQHGWIVGVGTGQGCRVKTCGRVADLQSCGLTRQTERAFCQWYSAEFPIYKNPIYNKLLASEPHDRHCPEATVNGIQYGKIRSQSEHVSRLAGSTGLKLLHHVL